MPMVALQFRMRCREIMLALLQSLTGLWQDQRHQIGNQTYASASGIPIGMSTLLRRMPQLSCKKLLRIKACVASKCVSSAKSQMLTPVTMAAR